MVLSPRRLLVGKLLSLSLDPKFGNPPLNLLFPSVKQSPQLSDDIIQILKRGGEKSSFSKEWKTPLIDPMNFIVDHFNLVKIIPNLTTPIFINNSNSITKFLLNRVLNTTETSFSHQIDSPNSPPGKDSLPITSPIVYFHLLNYFSRNTFKSDQIDFRHIYKIIHKMNINDVKLDINMINLLISNHIGVSNLMDRFQFESNFKRSHNFFDSIILYLSVLEKLNIKPNLTTIFLIYSSLPIDSIERSELRSFIIFQNLNNSKQWSDIAFIESIQCLLNNQNQLGLKILQSIPFINEFKPKILSLSSIRKSFLNLKFRSPITFTSFIQCQSSLSYGGWLRAVRIINGVILSTKKSKKYPSSASSSPPPPNNNFNKYIKYSIHERYRPSLTGSIGTIIIPKSLSFGSWDIFIKMINWSREIENGKINWSIIQKSIYSIINSNLEQPIMKLILIKYLLNIIPNDSIIISKRWDKIYWDLQNCIDFEFNKHSQLWGDSRLVRNQRTSIGVKKWISKLNNFNSYKSINQTSPISFNSLKLLKAKLDQPSISNSDLNENLLKEVNNLNLFGDLSYLNDLMTLDLSIVTEFELQLINDLKNLRLFDLNGELTLPKLDPRGEKKKYQHLIDFKIDDLNDPILIDLKNKLEDKINDFESNYWFDKLLNDRYCSWLIDKIKVND